MRQYKLFRPFLFLGLLFVIAALWPAPAAAQRRGPGGGRRVVVIRGYGGFGSIYFDPFYQYGYPYDYGYQYGYPYPPYGYPPYGGRYVRDELTSAIRLEVTPRTAEVYVDGYRAGVVDDFDGFLQRLHVRPGEHELVLYLEGYRTVHQRVFLSQGSDQKIRYTMVPLPPGERAEPRPEPPVEVAPMPPDQQQPPPRPRIGGRLPGGPPQGGPPQDGPQPGGPPQGGQPRGNQALQNGTFGSVSIRVQPADAEVLIDGEKWSTSVTADRLVVQLSEGRHHVDVQKDGYEKYSGDVQVRRGETVALNISLLRRAEAQ